MAKIYKDIFPIVHTHLNRWREKASQIQNAELRNQALSSINDKSFHCEGGGIFGLLSETHKHVCIEFIVAYQTISDYLDNLCDRSTSLDPLDFAMLHQSMNDALTVGSPLKNYYAYRTDQNDGGYLQSLVSTCQNILSKLGNYSLIAEHLLELSCYYCDLQVHKHVTMDERIPRLETWFEKNKPAFPDMQWYEFSACAGSTLGIFCLVSYAFRDDFSEKEAFRIRESYFPYVQGLHILLDYLIDQEEDRIGGDLNFCNYYETENEMMMRLEHFVLKADSNLSGIPHENFHKLIHRGLLGVYLSDEKVTSRKDLGKLARKLIKLGGKTSSFFYWNGRAYRAIQKMAARTS
ncbi:tetraprenyl-beta-curcumene synthase family protein [Metabacillus idriensis]|uniref:tetraprenyl-beta-curcumene synthase family protein n=1 Tax=Metabacillus idriensis TaxID=324768 RepID=UPI003D29C6D1